MPINKMIGGLSQVGQLSNQDPGPYIYTFSGKRLYFRDPEPAIDYHDIVHALSQLCRWTGHTRKFYSVAQHCVLCSYVGEKYQLRKLLHDWSEAYVNDVNKPLKTILDGSFAHVERTIDAAVYRKYGLGAFEHGEQEEVKRADLVVAVTEARDLLGQTDIAFYEGHQPLADPIVPWTMEFSRFRLLERFQELTNGRYS
jgi:5'-deoxynucleotidase YfbR-like HD superfamily hydrolase